MAEVAELDESREQRDASRKEKRSKNEPWDEPESQVEVPIPHRPSCAWVQEEANKPNSNC